MGKPFGLVRMFVNNMARKKVIPSRKDDINSWRQFIIEKLRNLNAYSLTNTSGVNTQRMMGQEMRVEYMGETIHP
jgi:hypothetical protein